MKRILSVCLCLLFLLTALPLGAIPVAAATSGTTGDCTWTLDGTHLTISGNGAMGDYASWSAAPWGKSIQSVTIENGVTNVGDYAFYDTTRLTSVTMGDTVTSIGKYAFYKCDMTDIEFSEGLTTIGTNAFQYCRELRSVTFPDSLTTIESSAFNRCYALNTVYVGKGLRNIGDLAFEQCTGIGHIEMADLASWCSISGIEFLTMEALYKEIQYLYLNGELISGDVVIPEGVTSIGQAAFTNCEQLTSVTIPDSVTSIGSSAFSGCRSLTDVHIGSGVTAIGNSAFGTCSLTTVVVPEGVATIGNSAFEMSSLISLTLPRSVTTIGSHLVYGNVTDVYYGGSEADRAAMDMGYTGGNEYLNKATWHYNSCVHTYDALCDGDCNRCGAVRSTREHAFDHTYDPDCRFCGLVRAVPEMMVGDANGDRKLNVRDLAYMQRYLNGWDISLEEIVCDVNGDGKMNLLDVGQFQRYLNGWDVTLGG